MNRHIAGVLGALALAAGCGGSNPGSGSRTFHVTALAQTDGSTDGTFLLVQVHEGRAEGALITDATVTLTGDKTGELTLPWTELDFAGFRLGSYRRTGVLWDTGWWLQVRRGDEGLEGYIEAPGQTSITEPAANGTYRRGEGKPLVVRWKDGENRRAEIVDVSFAHSSFGWSFGEDPLEFAVDPMRLDGTGSERVDVVRRNEVDLAGGTPGSKFTARTQHRINFAVE